MRASCQLCGASDGTVIVWGRLCLVCRGHHDACYRCVSDFNLSDSTLPGLLASTDDFARCLLPILDEFRVARAVMGEAGPERREWTA